LTFPFKSHTKTGGEATAPTELMSKNPLASFSKSHKRATVVLKSFRDQKPSVSSLNSAPIRMNPRSVVWMATSVLAFHSKKDTDPLDDAPMVLRPFSSISQRILAEASKVLWEGSYSLSGRGVSNVPNKKVRPMPGSGVAVGWLVGRAVVGWLVG